jgi:capsular polysaccharide biosynthesis protein
MELQDYAAALRRYWMTWVGVTLLGVVIATAVVLVAPRTYQATAQVFVASSNEGTSGSQFVRERVPSYPDIAESRTVLEPVIAQLELQETLPYLRARVSATNPPDTSQIDISVSDDDPALAAAVANAIAERFRTAVEQLERPTGLDSPVNLTVTDPATVPTAAVFPDPAILLPLGLVVGLALGVAAAVLRSRQDTRIHDEDDVRAAWGDDRGLVTVHSAPTARKRRRSSLAAGPATLLARELEPSAESRPLQVVVVAPPPDDQGTARSFGRDLAAVLQSWDVDVRIGAAGDEPRDIDRRGVQLTVASPSAPLPVWRRTVRDHDGVVVVVQRGRTHRADLRDLRSIIAAAGVPLLAVVLDRRSRGRTAPDVERAPVPAPAGSTRAPASRGEAAVAAARR